MSKIFSLIGIAITLALTGCGSDSNSSSSPSVDAIQGNSPMLSLDLVMPQQGRILEEDFPLSLYVATENTQESISSITSIDVNWPQFDVFQSGIEFGSIDGESEELLYSSVALDNDGVIGAIDVERQENTFWYVDGSGSLFSYDRSTEESLTWSVADDAEFSEISIEEEGVEQIWLYDRRQHLLVDFNVQSGEKVFYSLNGEVSVEGLATGDENLAILAKTEESFIVIQYSLEEGAPEHTASWFVEDFGQADVTDLAFMPDGRLAVSTDANENNLYLLIDSAELLGEGPIESSAYLELVQTIPLENAISQPSGLWPSEDGTWLMITDQAEVFILGADFDLIQQVEIDFDSINCNQGCTEAIVGSLDGFYAMTDDGLVGHFVSDGTNYVLAQEYTIDLVDEDGQSFSFGGLGYNPASGTFYAVTDGSDEDTADRLIAMNSAFEPISIVELSYVGDTDGSINTYDAQGVVFANNQIYVLSERYTKVLRVSLDGEILEVVELDGDNVERPSDMAIKDDLIYIIGDHELEESVPPVSVFELKENDS